MASFAKPLPFFFLLVLVCSSFIRIIHARQSVSFSKVTHDDNNNNDKNDNYVMEAEAEAPTPALQVVAEAPELVPTPAPTPSYTERDHGSNSGLYGLGSTNSPSTKETPTTITDVEDQILSEELSGESFDHPKGNYESTNLYNKDNINQDTGYTGNSYYVKNYDSRGGYNSNPPSGGNGISEQQGISKQDIGYTVNSYYVKNFDGRGGYNRNPPGGGNEISEQQGMSDTRFLENGKYYHDVKNEIKNNNFNGNYESDGRGSTRNDVEGYYGNSHSSNEFNTMEEYDRYQKTQGYVP
ncbi:hypothetical protein ACFX2J_046751 [Malus domestica]